MTLQDEFRTDLIEALKIKKCLVHFRKVNGEERRMTCTLDAKLIPESAEQKVSKSPRVVNPDVLPVYDIDAQGWRSFRINSIISAIILN